MRVKICGITSPDEARLAISAGADALGFLVGLNYRVRDLLTAARARRLIAAVPPFISTVLVTHSTSLSWVVSTVRRLGCSTVQLHGDFPLHRIPALKKKLPGLAVIKNVSVTDDSAIAAARRAARVADAVLLDSRTADRIGGSGTTHDWSISARIVSEIPKPVILAGGLTPENVARAIATVRPFAVDVNSGVEFPDGRKSPEKLAAFIAAAKGAHPASQPSFLSAGA